MRRLWLLMSLFLAMLSGCGGGGSKGDSVSQAPDVNPVITDPVTPPAPPTLQSIEISSQASKIPVGTELALSATGHYSDQSKRDISQEVTWASSNSEIATVDAQGRVRGLKAADEPIIISASFGGLSASRPLNISSAQLVSLQILAPKPLAAGESVELTLVGKYSDDSKREDLADQAQWDPSDGAVATVTKGMVTGLKPGKITITARIGESVKPATVEFQVTDAVLRSLSIAPVQPNLPEGEEQSRSSIELPRGVSGTLTATAYYSDGQTKDITKDASWSSADESIASFDANHPNRLTGNQASATEISATYNGVVAKTPVTVFKDIEAARSLLVSPPSATLSRGEQIQLKATGVYAYQTMEGQKKVYWDVTPVAGWRSANTTFATVGNDEKTSGLVMAASYGDVNITAEYRDVIGTASVAVTGATLQKIEVSYPESLPHPLLVIPFKAEGVWSDDHRRDITKEVIWSSSDPGAATVDNIGQVTLLPPGGKSATISASLGGNQGSTDITSTTATPKELWAQPENALHPLNFAFPYTVKCLFSDNSIAEVTKLATWTSSDPTVAIINADGKPGVTRTSNKTGSTTISASWQGLTDYPGSGPPQANLTVADPLPLELYWIRNTGNERQYPLPEVCDGYWCKEYASAPASQNYIYRRYRLKAGPNPITITDVTATSDKTTAALVGLENNQTLNANQEVIFTLEAKAPTAAQGNAKVQWSFNVQGLGRQFFLTVYLSGK